jgi:hypothetical protein
MWFFLRIISLPIRPKPELRDTRSIYGVSEGLHPRPLDLSTNRFIREP